jgi:hypothetical protein
LERSGGRMVKLNGEVVVYELSSGSLLEASSDDVPS